MGSLDELRRRWESMEFDPRDAPHENWHLLTFAHEVLQRRPRGLIVECGVFRGIGTAKLSWLAREVGRMLWAYDSFEGMPENEEPHDLSIVGKDLRGKFAGGEYAGTVDVVQANVDRLGVPGHVMLVEGWLEDTLPRLPWTVGAAYLDVDLASSTDTCLRELWPKLCHGGVIVSQDGEFPLVIETIEKWAADAEGLAEIRGLGVSKMVTIVKDGHAA